MYIKLSKFPNFSNYILFSVRNVMVVVLHIWFEQSKCYFTGHTVLFKRTTDYLIGWRIMFRHYTVSGSQDVQCAPFNGITFGQNISDPNNINWILFSNEQASSLADETCWNSLKVFQLFPIDYQWSRCPLYFFPMRFPVQKWGVRTLGLSAGEKQSRVRCQ